MSNRPDLVLYDRTGRLVAVVEVKAKRGTSREWAARLRQTLLAHDEAFSRAPFFLLATPDRLYLWKAGAGDSSQEASLAMPQLELDAKPLFGPYLERSGLRLENVGGEAFELVVMSWLGDLTRREASEPSRLDATGLPEAAREGRIADPIAA